MSNEELSLLTLFAVLVFLYLISRCGPSAMAYHGREIEC